MPITQQPQLDKKLKSKIAWILRNITKLVQNRYEKIATDFYWQSNSLLDENSDWVKVV
jgi:hypothetical protein